MRKGITSISAAAALVLILASSAHAGRASQRVAINDVYVIHFIIDGTNKKTFDAALEGGKLPTIQELFVENGAVFTHGLSNFPSTSTSVYQSYTSGLLPGHAGIPHLERFDRQREKVIGYLTAGGQEMVNTDFINLTALISSPDVTTLSETTTIFELLEGHPTAGIYTSFHRGAAIAHPDKAPVRALWSAYVAENDEDIDALAFRRMLKLFKKPLDKIPRYTLVGLYSSDSAGHRYGPESKKISDILVQFDLFLKDFLKLLGDRGIADRTYIIVSADHGMHATGHLFELQEALRSKGVFVKPPNPRSRNYSLYAANRGVVSSHIYVRHDGGFEPLVDPEMLRRFPTRDGEWMDLIDFMLGLGATDLAIVRAGSRRARILSHDGKAADVACFTLGSTDFCSYRFDRSKGDPLGYAKNPRLARLMDGRPHSTFAWREATAKERYPDAVIQLSQIFHDGRAGDIFITARNRFGFRKVKAGNHGGATDEDMITPLLIAGPGVPRGTFEAARPADIFPLLLDWFGLKVPKTNYDGRNPFEKYKGDDAGLVRLAALEQIVADSTRIGETGDAVHSIRGKFFGMLQAQAFGPVLSLAKDEIGRRRLLVEKLIRLSEALHAQRTDRRAPKVADRRYLDDHIDIVDRTLGWARQRLGNMEDVVRILTGHRRIGTAEHNKL